MENKIIRVSEILNFTPHPINIKVDGEIVEIKSSGSIRLSAEGPSLVSHNLVQGVPVLADTVFDHIHGDTKEFYDAVAVFVSTPAAHYIRDHNLRTLVFTAPTNSKYEVRNEKGHIAYITAVQQIC